jgi:amino acid adenylation domain-containing protein
MTQLEAVFSVPVIEAYGMTEASHQIATNMLPPGVRKPGSVGLPTGCEIAILDDKGMRLSAEQVGHVIIQGPNVTTGYANDPEHCASLFVDGWLRTGDQGRVDSDGYLFLTGRTKEIINRGGEQISPCEIEEVLIQHPAVCEAAAFAVPEDILGEDVVAGVVLHEHFALRNPESMETELREFTAGYLASFKVPRRIVFVSDIPKSSTGKLQRNALATALKPQLLYSSVLGEWERRQIVNEWNDTRMEYAREKCIHEMFEEQVERSPEAVAVVFEETSLSYGELNRRANQLAHYLRGIGVKAEDRVGICAERGLEMVVGLLGILKAGGAYVPLDPGYPEERLRYMLEDSTPVTVLTQDSLAGKFAGIGPAIPLLDFTHTSAWSHLQDTNLKREATGVTAENLAYVIYTSGSTGNPKGVMVSHRGLNNLVSWHLQRYGLGAGDRMTQTASPGFDAAVWEIWPVLVIGGRLSIVPDRVRVEPKELVEWLEEQEITIAFLATPLAEAALKVAWPKGMKLRVLLTGGDRLHAIAEEQYGFAVVNHYGPTESMVVASAGEVDCGKGQAPTIGRPIGNTRIYILDEEWEPVPVGVAGEIHIGGDGVGRGYLRRPELTGERFVADPFSGEAGAWMYWTGDVKK